MEDNDAALRKAALLYQRSRSLLVLAGAGMGVDSGIGTFRGSTAGIWPDQYKYSLPLAPDGSRGLSQLNHKRWFGENPEMAWDFWRWCHTNYCNSTPHKGYEAVLSLLKQKDGFVVTTNIDSHFTSSGIPFDRIRELHGIINRVKCSGDGRPEVTPKAIGDECDLRPLDFAEDFVEGEVDIGPCPQSDPPMTFSDINPKERIPRCLCGAVLRPDVTLFGDISFESALPPGPMATQHNNFTSWKELQQSLPGEGALILEIGAGTAMPTLRKMSSSLLAENEDTFLVRINTSESDVSNSDRELSINLPAMDALTKLRDLINHLDA
eukprot:TRINITY_DN12412_c0_g1_i2.p1 TRINITY_DN12412_c0_g1~~TRINITY_DN12412_c0_g1_i2.p1  ORF type:complete len:323 (+),score=56.76 TRINITY_DN12412_c0_g1_i2:145-1113(+)